jgi:hypothetical protein
MIDSKGRKTAAVIDLRRHRRIWGVIRLSGQQESLENASRRLRVIYSIDDDARIIDISVVRDRSDPYR